MSTVTIELTDHLREFVDSEASQRGCADAAEYIRLLVEHANEAAEIRRKIQEAEDEVARGECSEWKPGDVTKRTRALIAEHLAAQRGANAK